MARRTVDVLEALPRRVGAVALTSSASGARRHASGEGDWRSPEAPGTPTAAAVPSTVRRAVLAGLAAVTWVAAGCSSSPVRRQPHDPPPLSQDASRDLAIHAVGLVGTPYRWGGNTPQGGFDCSGLIGYVYRSRVGVAPPRTVAQLAAFGAAVDADDRRSGDLVLFGRGRPTHAGIYVGDGRFVHAPSAGGEVRVDPLDAGYWSRQATRYRRP